MAHGHNSHYIINIETAQRIAGGILGVVYGGLLSTQLPSHSNQPQLTLLIYICTSLTAAFIAPEAVASFQSKTPTKEKEKNATLT